MSLRAFHLVFIAAATLTLLGFGVWGAVAYARTGAAAALAYTALGLALGAALEVYLLFAARKLRELPR